MDKRIVLLQAILEPLPHIERHNIRSQGCKEDPGAGRASACGPTYSSGGMISVESPSSMENGLLAVASMNRRWHARVSNADMDIELTSERSNHSFCMPQTLIYKILIVAADIRLTLGLGHGTKLF